MSQQPFAFSRQDRLPLSVIGPAKRLLRLLRSPQIQIGFVVCAALLGFAFAAVRPDSAYPTVQLLLTFYAVILGYLSSFWGLWVNSSASGFDGLPYSPRRIALAERERLLWSVAPTVLGGSGMLLPLFLPQDIGTLMLLTGFSLLVALEALGPRHGFEQADFKRLRWTISIMAIVMLLDVLLNQRWSLRVLF